MRHITLAVVLSGLVAPTLPLPALCDSAAKQADIADPGLAEYGQLPSFDLVELSPDGSRLAYVGAIGDARHVLVKDFATGRKLVDFVEAKGQKIRGLQWADNNHLLTEVSMTTSVSLWGGEWGEYFGVIAADLDTGQAWDVLKFPGGVPGNADRINLASGRIRTRLSNGQPSLYLSGYFISGVQWEAQGRMMRVNLLNRSHALIENRDVLDTYSQLMDEHGEVVAASTYKQETGHWRIDVGNHGQLRQAMAGEALIDIPQFEGISPDGQSIWLITKTDGVSTARNISLADGHLQSAEAPPSNLHRTAWNSVLTDPRNDRIIGGVIVGATQTTYEFVDPAVQKQWQSALDALGNASAQLISISDDLRRAIVLTDTSTGPQYQLVDMATSNLAPLGPRRRHVPAISEVQSIEYPAADGMTIQAYLTLPANRPKTKLPLVVLPHGGPQSRDYSGFDWWAQALAYEGYAVLQPNFRGSTISDTSVAAGSGQWGRKMQTDLSDGVRYLAEKGTIDSARVCIVGASYGGYAALAGVSMQHGIYRCAVAVAGVSDLRKLMKPTVQVRGNANASNRYFERWLGVTDLDDPSVDDRSPVKHADTISVPVMLIHGSDDTVVPFDQSSRMADALQRLHKPFQMVKLESEDHWLSRGQTRLQMLDASVAFLKTNNPPDGPRGASN